MAENVVTQIDTAARGSVAERARSHGTRHRSTSWTVTAALVILQLACGGCQMVSSPQPPAVAAASGSAAEGFDQLTPQEQNASRIAEQNGDREYLMVDKVHGRIRWFRNGTVVLTASALTGENKSDRLPPGTLDKEFSRLGQLEDKVTPAGRFTVSQSYDKEYGTLFEINEIQGPDWNISIHQVYLGTPSERRADRLKSPHHDDKHITHGCINVTRGTIQQLIANLPQNRPTRLYVLPYDQSQTTDFLAKRG